MTRRCSVTVRFDVGPRAVSIRVGGHVAHEALDELRAVIGRSVQIAGRPAEVDLSAAEIDEHTLRQLRGTCVGIATVSSR